MSDQSDGVVEIARGLMRRVSDSWADGLTEAATIVRDAGAAMTADEVADLLTGLAAVGTVSAQKHFGGEL